MTILAYLDYIDKGVWMRKRLVISIFFILIAGILLISLHSAAVKQVRVIADRATIYSEPARSSARIDVVEKGTVLTLFQQNKVRDVWYYISFQSPTYGARISGFIHESAVEVVVERPTLSPTRKIAEREKAALPPEKEVAVPPKIEKKAKPEPVAPPRPEETLIASRLPQTKVLKVPRRLPQLREAVWKPLAPVRMVEPPKKAEIRVDEKKPVKLIETFMATPLPRSRAVGLPAKGKARDDRAWKIVQPAAEPQQVKPLPKVEPKKGPGLFVLGLGYGQSLGGAGVSLQFNTKAGFALHGGLGYYPTTLIYSETDWVKNTILYSAGVKYYLPVKSSILSPYVDVQYGGLRVEAAQIVLGVWEYTYVLGQEQKTLWGPSVLAGAEFRKGRFGLNGAVGISYALTEWEYLKQKVSFSFDLSFLVHF